MTIRAVLWDVDDTLFDYTGADRVGIRNHLAAEGLTELFPSVDHALRHWRAQTDLHWARFAARDTDFQGQRRARVRGFLGADLDNAEADSWFERYVAHFEAGWALFPDSLAALDWLAGDYRQAVLSNSSLAYQERKLGILGVRQYFEAVLCSAELGASKPEAAAFHGACDALNLDPSEVLYVGNDPDLDAAGAVAAGLVGIWLDRDGVAGRPGLPRITDLGQLPAHLNGVCPPRTVRS
ncbi:HAD family hydrolase [Rugosimonospora acidiphila]|uniref:HAD family hydrolase n=1 Tax=Rugosimonospora acidiphila TaxID=556531 RepID=A0ABP9SCV0_9ACTN